MDNFDRNTALSVLKDLSKCMYPDYDLYGKPTLAINRNDFEKIRAKYLDKKREGTMNAHCDIAPSNKKCIFGDGCQLIACRIHHLSSAWRTLIQNIPFMGSELEDYRCPDFIENTYEEDSDANG